MLRARMTLENLRTLSYNFPDQNVSLANEFTEKVNSRLPNEAGLILLSQAQESVRSTKQREHIKTQNMQIYHLGRNTRKVWRVEMAARLTDHGWRQTSQR